MPCVQDVAVQGSLESRLLNGPGRTVHLFAVSARYNFIRSENPHAQHKVSLHHGLCALLLHRSAHSGCSSASSQRGSATVAARRLDFPRHRTLSCDEHAEESSSSAAMRLGRTPANELVQTAAQRDMHSDACSSAASLAQQSDGVEEDPVSSHGNTRPDHATGLKLPSPQLLKGPSFNSPAMSRSASRYSAEGDGMWESTESSRTSACQPASTAAAPPCSEVTAANGTAQEQQPGPLRRSCIACPV